MSRSFVDTVTWPLLTRRWRRTLDALVDCSSVDRNWIIWTGVCASVWKSACRVRQGARHAAAGGEYARECQGGIGGQVRRLPLERDTLAGLRADRARIVADRTGHRRC